MEEVRITTSDNPYDPFKDFDEWLFFDQMQGYHTCERLARIVSISDSLTDQENKSNIEKAMDELIRYGAFGKKGNFVEYKKVYENK